VTNVSMAGRKPRVVYWNRIPSPYIQERFDALVDRGNLRFEAWFTARTEPDRSWQLDESCWRFPYRYLPGVGKEGGRVVVPPALLRGNIPDVLVSLYADPSFVLGSVLARSRRILHAYYVEKTFDTLIQRKRWKETLKRALFAKADGVLAAGKDARQFVRKYGVPESRIYDLPNATDVGFFSTASGAAREKRDDSRRTLGLRGLVFLFVGRRWWLKGLEYLIDGFGELNRRYSGQVSLLLVGDGPDGEALRQRCERQSIDNVVFIDYVQKQDLPRIYGLADVFVFPTLGDSYGLVVDEAMACGLPVISTSAAGEIRSRVEDGVTGFVVPPRSSAALAERMATLTSDPDLARNMGLRGFKKISTQTPDMWAEHFERAVEGIMSAGACR